MERDGRLRAVATEQGGAFTRSDAIAAGFSAAAIRHRLDAGMWVAATRGVYLEPSTQADGRRALASAGLLAYPGSAVSHLTAADVLKIPRPRRESAHLHLTRPSGRPRTPVHSAQWVVHTAAHVAPTVRRTGLDVTSAARTVVDLTRTTTALDGLIAADHVLRHELATREELRDATRHQRRWPYVERARTIVELASPLSESPGESFSRLFFAEQHLPMPEQQIDILGPVGQRARVDFLWRERWVIGEFDGMTKYDDPTALRAEKVRQEWLEELGYRIVRWTWQQLMRESVRTEQRIRRALWRGGSALHP